MAGMMSFDVGDGSGYTSVIYRTAGKWWSNAACTDVATSVSPLPTPPTGFSFDGYYSQQYGYGTKYINTDGTFTDEMVAFNPYNYDTVSYANYTRLLWTVTLNSSGGSGGTGGLFYKINGGGIYSDTSLTNLATTITIPTKSNSRFLGYYSAASGGTQYISASGTILTALSSLTITADLTIYAQWETTYTVTLNKMSGSGGHDALYAKADDSNVYSDSACTTAVTSITPPTKAGNTFLGYYSSSSGGTKYINADGSFTSSFPSSFSASRTFYAHWNVNALVLYLDINGGEGVLVPSMIFYKSSTWYSDEGCTDQITSITVPTRRGYTFGGYKSGSTVYITTAGVINSSSISADVTATAAWTANTYTIGFDYNGGNWYEPYTTQKTVTFGQAVGELPETDKEGYYFGGWRTAGRTFTADTVWSIASDATMTAYWYFTWFGNVEDYFNLGSSVLIPESSDSGDTHQHTCAYNATSESPATETGGIWRNPRVTYRVCGDMTLNVTLGMAFAGVTSGTGSSGTVTQSGYMISSVEVTTAVGEAPTVTVSAVANEGFTWVKDSAGTVTGIYATATNAVKTYSVSIPITARHRPQNLLSSISCDADDLQELTLIVRGDPVVVAENGMPCASDMTHGRIEVTARTAAYNDESAPTAGTGFAKTSEPVSHNGVGYKYWNVSLRKELA